MADNINVSLDNVLDRITMNHVTVSNDLRRNVTIPVVLVLDTARDTAAYVLLDNDTDRTVGCAVALNNDTDRILHKAITVLSDTSRKIPHVFPNADTNTGIKSISISLQSKTLADTFQLETVHDINILDALKGRVLDYDYSYIAEEYERKGIITTVRGSYDSTEILQKGLTYKRKYTDKAGENMSRVADALGLQLDAHFRDFTPTHDTSLGGSYQSIISTLFGWSDRLPRYLVNVFIRNNAIRIIQRGYETNKIDLTNVQRTVPTISRKIVRSYTTTTIKNYGEGAEGKQGYHEAEEVYEDKTTDPSYFSGTISGGGASMSYSAGYLISSSDGKSYTHYSYDSYGCLSSKSTDNYEDGSTVSTEYNYTSGDGAGRYLSSEIETTRTWQSNVGTELSRSETYHSYCGNGWYSTSRYVDGVYQGGSLSQGKPGSQASRYMMEEGKPYKSLKETKLAGPDDSVGNGVSPNFDNSFPISDKDYLHDLTQEMLNWNNNIEEKVSFEVYNYGHMIDFTDKVILDGNEYFLESNQYDKDPRTEKQSVTLIRWYKKE